ncbi:MAG: hypothetical protein ACK46L_09160 [Synechococcaceae cyanobacterium]
MLAQLDVPSFETLLRDWMAAQPGVLDSKDGALEDEPLLQISPTVFQACFMVGVNGE